MIEIDSALARLYALHMEGLFAPEIAMTLNSEGYTTLRGKSYNPRHINVILCRFRSNSRSRYTVALKRAGANNGH